MGKNRNAYIHQIAMQVIGQIGCLHEVMNGVYDEDTRSYYQYDHNSPEFPQVFWRDYGYMVKEAVGKMGPQARGRIIACGVAESGNGMVAYHEVNGCQCNTKMSGEELLTLLASYVVTAAIVDIFRSKIKSEWEEAERYQRQDARDRHFERGEGSELEEWFKRNPLT